MGGQDDDFDIDAPRKHGLEGPYDVLQYVAGFAYALFMLSFALLHGPMLTPSTWTYIVIALFCIWAPLSVVTYIISALVPVHDPVIDQQPMNDVTFARYQLKVGEEYKCRACAQVVSTTSKHCWSCGKCVAGFDHHCRWLNHCVGERNYAHFAVFLSNTFVLLTIQASIGWFLCIETATDFDQFAARAERAFESNRSGAIALAVFTWFIAFLEFVVVLVLGQLFFLHVELNIRGITTYDLILIKRRDAALRRNEREDLGLPTGPPSPTCHALMVYRRRRELGISDEENAHGSKYEAGKASAFDRHDGDDGGVGIEDRIADDVETDSEPSLNVSRSSLEGFRATGSFRRSAPNSARGAAGGGSGRGTPIGSPHNAHHPQHHTTGSGSQAYAVHAPAEFSPMNEEPDPYRRTPRDRFTTDDEDDDDEGVGVMSSSCTSIGSDARRRSNAFRRASNLRASQEISPDALQQPGFGAASPTGARLPQAASSSVISPPNERLSADSALGTPGFTSEALSPDTHPAQPPMRRSAAAVDNGSLEP